MNITITGRNTGVKDSFKERVDRKLSKFDRFFGDNAKASVTVTKESDRETVEITIKSDGLFFRAEKTAAERMDALEAVTDSLFRQIVKNKNKLSKRLKETAFSPEYEDEAFEPEEYRVLRTKRVPVKPMDPEEAILQMNMLGHEFFMFRNAVTNEINVVYRRHGDSYGLIEPSDDEDEE